MRILVINPFGIGDVLFSTPLIEAIRANYADSFIGYICNRRAYEVIKGNPDISRIFVYEKDDFRAAWDKSPVIYFKMLVGLLKSLSKERFDIAIDLSLGYQYSLLLMIIGIRRRIGFNYRDRGRFLTDAVTIDGFHDKHVVEYYLDLLVPLGIDPAPYRHRPKVYVDEADRSWAAAFLAENGVKEDDRLIGMIPGCGASWGVDADCRRWDRVSFAEVCRKASSRFGAKIILFGDPKELQICADIQDLLSNTAIMACGKTSIGGFLGLLERCSVVVTNDGGPLHMASALGIRTVSLFGPVDEKVYGPYPPNSRHIIVTGKTDCRPCYRNFKYSRCPEKKCLATIMPEEVLSGVEKVLRVD